MNPNLIKLYFEKVPAVICTAGSYIATKNAKAQNMLGWLPSGGRLFDWMDPRDVLKYEAHFARAEDGEYFTFTSVGVGEELYCIAFFDSICSRRFSEVLFFHERELPEKLTASVEVGLSEEEKITAASLLLSIGDESFEPSDKRGLLDIRVCTQRLMQRLSDSGINVCYSEDRNMANTDCMPENIPLVNYLQMVSLMMLSADELAGGGEISAMLHRYGSKAELSVCAKTTRDVYTIWDLDELSVSCPLVCECLSICRYVAGLSGCALEIEFPVEGDHVRLLLSLDEDTYSETDFKSRDALLYFDSCYSFVEHCISLIRSGNAK